MSVCLLVFVVVWLVLVDSLVHLFHFLIYVNSAFVLILSMLCVEKPCILLLC